MNSQAVVQVIKALGVSEYSYGLSNVYCSCPLAKWNHSKGVDSRPSMSIKTDPTRDSLCMCWSPKCDFKGTLIQLAYMVNHMSGGQFDGAVDLARKLETEDLSSRLEAILNPPPEEPARFLEETALSLFRGHVPRYALDRKVPIEFCKKWELGYDTHRMRLVFPVRDIHGRLTGLMGRAIFEDQNGPTWYAYPGFQKGRYLYGENWVFPGSGRIILVEGQFDVIRCDINGIVNSVALMGSAFTEFHERTVLNWGLPVYWFLDGDESGQKARLKAIEQLRGKLPQYVAKCPDGKDPDNLDPAEMKAVLDAAEFVI